MLTKDMTEELQSILETLAKEGKEPTVALVKARLSSKVPMPALITTIKRWKTSNTVPKVEIAQSTTVENTKIDELEQTVLTLAKRVEALELQLAQHQKEGK